MQHISFGILNATDVLHLPCQSSIKKNKGIFVDKHNPLYYNKPCVVKRKYIQNEKVRTLEKYSRGRRGAPAKGVGRATGARVQIPPSPL